MSDSRGRPDERALLDVFERATPAEPLTTSEVADELGCARRTTYDRLESLVERGRLETKKVGASGRVWWQPWNPDEELTSEQVLELEYHSEQAAQPFLETADGDLHISVDAAVSLSDGTGLQYYTVRGLSPDAYLDVLTSYPGVTDARLLSISGDEYLVESHTSAATMAATFARFGGRTSSIYLEDGRFHVEGTVPATTDLDALTAALEDLHADIALAAQRLVYTPRLFRHLVEDRLTDRQLSALESAYYAGYFATPRASTGEELAERMDVTRQTFHHHLRRAEEAVLEQLFDGSADDVL